MGAGLGAELYGSGMGVGMGISEETGDEKHVITGDKKFGEKRDAKREVTRGRETFEKRRGHRSERR